MSGPQRAGGRPVGTRRAGFHMEALIGYLLLGGVLLSVTLIVVGVAWHWAATGRLQLEYTISGMNLYQFVRAEISRVSARAVDPRLLVNLGIVVLMLTPYVRVAGSVVYFGIERNWKYVAFTGVVLGVLTYSLFLR